MQIPRRVSAVGFEDIAPASFVTPPLATMALPPHPMGVAAGERILRLLGGAEQPPEVRFTPKLTVRESSAAPPTPVEGAHTGADGARGRAGR